MKFIIGFLITIGLLIFVFVLIFRGGGNDQQQKLQTKLLNYVNSSVEMQLTVRGQVSADQTHKEYRITIGNTESTIEVFDGYQGNLVSSQTYPNNGAAYAAFLQALQLAGYTLGNDDKKVADDRGYCATGTRYIMGIKDGNKDIQRYWATSCGGAATFKGKTNLVTGLFNRQIPDFEKIAGNAL